MGNYRLLLLLAAIAATPHAPAQTMPRLYMDYCAVCHLPGIHGAPKVGDRTEWTRRVRLGLNATTRVESRNGVVAMIGIVEDAEVARLAYDAVKRIPGIQKIDNRLMSGHQMGWD